MTLLFPPPAGLVGLVGLAKLSGLLGLAELAMRGQGLYSKDRGTFKQFRSPPFPFTHRAGMDPFILSHQSLGYGKARVFPQNLAKACKETPHPIGRLNPEDGHGFPARKVFQIAEPVQPFLFRYGQVAFEHEALAV